MSTVTISEAQEVRTLPAGRWWDAVRVPLGLGAPALEHLGDEAGAVIKDGYGGILYWLIRPGGADHWRLPQVQVLGTGCHVAVPPRHRTRGPGLYWLVPMNREGYWTRPERLRSALWAARGADRAPRSAARPCCRCARSTEAPVLVRLVEYRSGPADAVYACPDCAPHCPAGPGHAE